MKTERIKWIDALRAGAMFSVVLGHLYKGGAAFLTITDPIKMPLFYFLAGYVFHTDKHWGDFLRGIAFRIGIPYFLFSLFPLKVLRFLIQRDIPALLEYLTAFFTGRIVWFIPSFVLTQIFVFLLYRVLRGNPVLIAAASILCFVIGVNTADVVWMDFWCINTALTAVLYMNFGLLMRQYGASLRINSSRAIAINTLIYLCGILCALHFYPGCTMDVHLDSYYNVPLCLILIVSGILLCMGVSQNIPWEKAAEPWLIFGQETLFVFLTHSTIQFILSILLRPILPINDMSFWVSLIYTALTCMVGTIVSRGIGNYIPELVGRRRITRKHTSSKSGKPVSS